MLQRWGCDGPFPLSAAVQLVALFAQYGVSFYFAGHGHTYNRMDATAWGDGAIHIMAGAAGCDETPFPEVVQ